jgi:hypothetical protein
VSTYAQLIQTQLRMSWKIMAKLGGLLPSLDEVSFSVHSQNGEDGILLYLFTLLGTTNKKLVEICAGNGEVCNSANLIVNQGWEGLLFDGDADKVQQGVDFFKSNKSTQFWPPRFQCAWITRDNVNELVSNNNFQGEIDLLSIDLDGNDYWIWKALDVVSPRVVVAEYQAAWGPEVCITQRYQEDFDYGAYRKANPGRVFIGASLGALTLLAKQKGYRLVGCEPHCFNAFFVREELGRDIFPAVPQDRLFSHSIAKWNMARIGELVDLSDPFWVRL